MELFDLFRQEIKTSRRQLYTVATFVLLSGFSNVFLIAVINSAAASVANGEIDRRYIFLYALCLWMFFYSKRYTQDWSLRMIVSVVSRVRYRLANRVRFMELATLEKYGTSSIYARISQDANAITNFSLVIANSLQQAIMVLFILLYIAAVSPWSFVLVALSLAAGVFYYIGKADSFRQMWRIVSEKETNFFEKLGHILNGAKEIRLNRRKNENVFKAFDTVNEEIRDFRIRVIKSYNILLIFLEIFIYGLLGIIIFGLSHFHTEHAEVITKVVAAVLFTIGPLEGIIFSFPTLGDANNCARNIMELETQLEEEQKELDHHPMDSQSAYQTLPFTKGIQLNGLSYQYPSDNIYGVGFQVGPIEFTMRKGELVFVTGGNGSGKSTFLKLLVGLYKPESGYIQVDGEEKNGHRVSWSNYQQYQNLFSIIFSDYHLFDKLYGLEQEVDPAVVNALLQRLGLSEEKTIYKDGAFSNIDLSSGQRKRLALATVMLEDKPIYIFDEVAADLDPDFRDKFYFEILQELKTRNKTVLVVTHDQQYWNACDRLVQFQDGLIRELSRKEIRALVEIATDNK